MKPLSDMQEIISIDKNETHLYNLDEAGEMTSEYVDQSYYFGSVVYRIGVDY